MIDLQDYGFNASETDIPSGLVPARITQVHRERYQAVCPYGEVDARLKGTYQRQVTDRDDYPAVGDFVLIRYNESGTSLITERLPRRSKFSRSDFSGHAAGYVKTIREQVVAANFDTVFILSSLNQDFNLSRISRYLTLARQSGGTPVIILSKADLCEDCEAQVSATKEMARDVDVIALSSLTGRGLDRLRPYLQPAATIVFLGMSGVGKSSLLNALAGTALMEVKAIRETDARGRHTTTHRQLFQLPSGVMVIDTPGMREMGLWDADSGISASFADIEVIIARCRFSNCQHNTEPGCAIQAALADQSLPQEQWDSYLAQRREAAFVARRIKPTRHRT